MKTFAAFAVLAGMVMTIIALSDINFWLGLGLVAAAISLAMVADAINETEAKQPKKTISLSKAAREQQRLAQA